MMKKYLLILSIFCLPLSGQVVKNIDTDTVYYTGSLGNVVREIGKDYVSVFGPELILNNDFETFTGTADDDIDDDWTSWSEGGTGITEATTTKQSGSYGAKLKNAGGTYVSMSISQSISTVDPSTDYQYTFYVRGDGSNAGAYRVYDVTNAANIISNVAGNTGVSGTSYILVQDDFTTPSGCETITIYFYGAAADGSVVYVDNVSLKKKL